MKHYFLSSKFSNWLRVLFGLVVVIVLALVIGIFANIKTIQTRNVSTASQQSSPTPISSLVFLPLVSKADQTNQSFLYALFDAGKQTTLQRFQFGSSEKLLAASSQSRLTVASDLPSIQNIIDASLSPNGKYLAIVERFDEGRSVIRFVDLQNGKKTFFPQLGKFGEPEEFFDWLPDGIHMLVQTPDRKLWVVNVESKDEHVINFDGTVVDAVASPDGVKVLVVVYFGSGLGGEIWATNLAGNDRKLLLKEQNKTLVAPTWSRNGEFIAFYKAEDVSPRQTELWVMKADGTDARLLGPAIVGSRFHSVWNPHQNILANIVPISAIKASNEIPDEEHIETGIAIIDPTSGEKRIVAPGKRNSAPAWSPDGKVLTFISNASGVGEIWGATQDGKPFQITNDGTEKSFPFWVFNH